MKLYPTKTSELNLTVIRKYFYQFEFFTIYLSKYTKIIISRLIICLRDRDARQMTFPGSNFVEGFVSVSETEWQIWSDYINAGILIHKYRLTCKQSWLISLISYYWLTIDYYGEFKGFFQVISGLPTFLGSYLR